MGCMLTTGTVKIRIDGKVYSGTMTYSRACCTDRPPRTHTSYKMGNKFVDVYYYNTPDFSTFDYRVDGHSQEYVFFKGGNIQYNNYIDGAMYYGKAQDLQKYKPDLNTRISVFLEQFTPRIVNESLIYTPRMTPTATPAQTTSPMTNSPHATTSLPTATPPKTVPALSQPTLGAAQPPPAASQPPTATKASENHV